MTRGTREIAPHEVMIVSTNPETLDGLQAYLQGAGVRARSTRDLSECTKLASDRPLAVVFFPDDFRWEQVVETLARLAGRRPPALPIVVTAHPQRFESVVGAGELLIVPRPVWGWAILDAIRERAR